MKKYIIWIVCLVCIIGAIIFLYAGKDATKKKNENSETFDSVFDDVNLEEDEDSSMNQSNDVSDVDQAGDKADVGGNDEGLGDNETDNKADSGKVNSEEGDDINDQKEPDSDTVNDESHTEKFSVDKDTETKYGPIY